MNESGFDLEAPYPASPERIPLAPRTVALNNRARWFRGGTLAGFLALPNAILLIGWATGENLRNLEARGQTVTGQTVAKTLRHGRNNRFFTIDYVYSVRDRDYGKSVDLSTTEAAGFEVNRSCPVTYLPENPTVSYPGRPGPPLEKHNTGTVLFAALAAGILLAFFVTSVFLIRGEMYLAREGEPIVGRVTERGTTRGRNRTIYWVRHEFNSPADESITDWHYVPESLWQRLRPALRVTILFDPIHHKRHLPLYAFKYAYIVEQENSEPDFDSPPST